MSNWGGLDFFIFLILLFNTLFGMARGGLREIISIMCLCAALIFTIKFTLPLSSFINSSPLMSDVIASNIVQNFMLATGLGALTTDMLIKLGYAISLLICFVGTFSVCEAVLSYTNVVQVFSFPYSFWDRKLGAALGCLRGYVFVVIFILLYLLMSHPLTSSYFINLFRASALNLSQLIVEQSPERYREVLQGSDRYNANMVLDVVNYKKK